MRDRLERSDQTAMAFYELVRDRNRPPKHDAGDVFVKHDLQIGNTRDRRIRRSPSCSYRTANLGSLKTLPGQTDPCTSALP